MATDNNSWAPNTV
jgi:hypothetical protein